MVKWVWLVSLHINRVHINIFLYLEETAGGGMPEIDIEDLFKLQTFA